MIPCVWYVSRTVRPWVRAVIGNMAAALKARGVSLSLYIGGGTGINAEGSSWEALTGLERAGQVLFSGKGTLWHLWGSPPVWWSLVRLRSRTVHTSFRKKAAWRGYPSRLFPSQASGGEVVLIPTFGSRVSRVDDLSDGAPAVYMGSVSQTLQNALKGMGGVRTVNLNEARLPSVLSGVLVTGPGPSDALRAASLAVQGLAVAALRSPFLDALLGPDGYLVPREDTEEAWARTLEAALSDEGRRLAVSARHFIQARCSPDRSADSLIAAYREVLG